MVPLLLSLPGPTVQDQLERAFLSSHSPMPCPPIASKVRRRRGRSQTTNIPLTARGGQHASDLSFLASRKGPARERLRIRPSPSSPHPSKPVRTTPSPAPGQTASQDSLATFVSIHAALPTA